MSALAGSLISTTPPPIENWGTLKWTTKEQEVKKTESGTGMDKVKQEGDTDNKNGVLANANSDVLLQLVSTPKPNQHNSGASTSGMGGGVIVQIPVSTIASASGTTKNDLSLALRPQASVTTMPNGSSSVPLELTSIRFAIPNVCVGHEQTEEAGREILAETHQHMKEQQSRLLGNSAVAGAASEDQLLLMMAGGGRKDERVIGVLDDLTFSYPSGRYKLIVSNYALVLEDKKRSATAGGTGGGAVASIPLTDVLQLYLCDIPDSGNGENDEDLAQYVVLILRNPLKIRTTTYNHIVISCPSGFSLDEDHPWRCQLETQEEINQVLTNMAHNQNTLTKEVKKEGEEKVLKNTFTPTMSGRVSEILIRILKAVTGATALGGHNKEYQTSRGYSVLRCLHHGADGLLFVLNSALLFLHRPVTRVLYSEIKRIEVDESEKGNSTFQIAVYGSFGRRSNTSGNSSTEDKLLFSALDKREKTALLAYLEKKVTVRRVGVVGEDDDDDDEEDEEDDARDDEEEEEEDEEEFDEEDDDDDDDDESDESGDDKDRKSRKRARSKKHEKKKDKKEKKEKGNHKKSKKEKDVGEED
ncbi:structure-specific recognition protein 1 [Trypanosoma theileri]|uniref:Structure-specific recognition protein 1 n=1 Tax=Trypanosoma theileri TaxID=67003 RepID=A0A1X0P6K5_9TRYP|nr:structure-specific recognition protein 1 [Trypanosoma theileri]ORC92562.1 structure-specific recognition protein 1 [Trypanosoma theileri]